MTIHRVKSRDWLLLLLILFVAALLRFGQAGIVEFFHDDAMLSSLVQQMVTGEKFPITGINSSVGVPNPPISVYILGLPFALNLNPSLAIYFVMGWNVLGVAVLWGIAQRYFGRTVALIAGLTYAVSPWAVLFSRKIWAQDYHTPFILIALFLGLYGFWEQGSASKGRWWAQVLSLPMLLIGLQIHFAAWALAPLYLIVLFVGRKQIAWKALILSAVISLIVLLPFSIGLFRTLQADPNRLSAVAERSEISTSFSLSAESLISLFRLTTGLGMESWIAPHQQVEMNQAVPPLGIWWLSAASAILGIGVVFRPEKRIFAPLLLAWAFLPALALVPQWTDVYVHYFIGSIPALCLLIGLGIGTLAQIVPVQPYGRSIILLAYIGILLTQALYFRAVLRFVDQTPIAYPGFTIPMHYLSTIEAELSQYEDIVVLSDGMAWDLNHESVVWDVLLRDSARCVRTLKGDGYAVFPNHAFVALQAPNMPLDGIGQIYQHDNGEAFVGRGASETYTLYAWDAAPAWQGVPLQAIHPSRFDNGVSLTGYAIANSQLFLEWHLPARQATTNLQFSGKLLDASGTLLTQRDNTFWHGRHWCEGDRLLTWVTIPEVSGLAELQVSLYRLGGANEAPYISANVLDEAGNPQGQAVIVPLN